MQMNNRKSEEIWRSAWGNHILNAIVGSALTVIGGYLLMVWEIPLFWVLGLLAIVFAFLYNHIPKRYQWFKITIMLSMTTIAIIYAKAGITQYLVLDVIIFFITLEIINYVEENKMKGRSKRLTGIN